ncbi:hypothetical protein DFH09DRAFT_1162491 [Mycena vulgaris]|nr:hypothetical protein DFH09DRAFT_1162491 [Mycena vulgaris]
MPARCWIAGGRRIGIEAGRGSKARGCKSTSLARTRPLLTRRLSMLRARLPDKIELRSLQTGKSASARVHRYRRKAGLTHRLITSFASQTALVVSSLSLSLPDWRKLSHRRSRPRQWLADALSARSRAAYFLAADLEPADARGCEDHPRRRRRAAQRCDIGSRGRNGGGEQ